MDLQWFDENSGTVLLDDYVLSRESYKRIMQDQQVTATELHEQTQTVISLLKQLEGMLSPEAKAVATDALCELAVLHVLRAQQDVSANQLPLAQAPA